MLHAYQQFTTRVPDEITSSIALIRMPDVAGVPEILRGRLTVHVRIYYLGSEADGNDLIAPLRAVAPTLTDSVRDRPHTEFSMISPGPAEPRAVANDGSNGRPASGVDLMHRLAPWPAGWKISNFRTPADATVQGTRIAFDEPIYARLRSVKTRYDPRNTFRFNHNIPPDGAAAI